MAYEPLSGWVQVTKQQDTGVLNHQRFHKDRECAENAVAAVIAKGQQQGRPVNSYLSEHLPYAQASRLALLGLCKCSGGPRGHHIAQSDRRFGEVQGGSPGTGRRH